jgi:XTP/dITP diphosphohydrolase
MSKIIYVTKNWAKLKGARQALEPLGITVENVEMETTEIQANTVEEIAIHSAKEASNQLKCTVLKNDSGLYVEALNGFPGPYTKYAEETITEDGLLKLLEKEENRNAYFIEAFAYCEYNKDPVVFTSITRGTIAKEKSGQYGWSWDYIFIPEGKNKTLANFEDSERLSLWNQDAYQQLANYITKNKNE